MQAGQAGQRNGVRNHYGLWEGFGTNGSNLHTSTKGSESVS